MKTTSCISQIREDEDEEENEDGENEWERRLLQT